jgi:hypothetical protein
VDEHRRVNADKGSQFDEIAGVHGHLLTRWCGPANGSEEWV